MFYTYRQNNSGGSFVYDADLGIAIAVIVEADDLPEASAKAEDIGLYFDGCETGRDCDCCGDRWSEPWDDGTETPSLYGRDVTDPAQYIDRLHGDGISRSFAKPGDSVVFVHYADGTTRGYGAAV